MKIDKRIFLFIGLLLAGSAVTLGCCAFFINKPQVFSDIIPLALIGNSYNVSIENTLLYVLLFGAMIISSVVFLVKPKWFERESYSYTNRVDSIEDSTKSGFFIIAAIASALVSFFVFKHKMQLPIAITAVVSFIIYRKAAYETICSFILTSYSLIGLYWTYVLLGGTSRLSSAYISVIAALVSLSPLLLKKYTHRIYTVISMVGCFLTPLSLLIFFKQKYIYENQLETISVPTGIRIVVILVIVGLIVNAIMHFKKGMPETIDKAVTLGPIVSIIAYNRFDGTGAVMSTDLHHPFENIIGFQQMFELGQKPFEEFIPISGAYSLLHGAVHYIFGEKGMFSNYYVTRNLFFLFVAIIIGILLLQITDGSYALLLALLFYLPSYNRYAFILPILLLLLNPKLFCNRRKWLVLYFLTSLFHGLYYPVYGASVFLAFVPMGLFQFFKYIKDGGLKEDLKKWNFYVEIAICILALGLSWNYLFGTFKHILTFSKVGEISEGLSRFGFTFPDWFLPGTGSALVRICLWYVLTFLIPLGVTTIAWIMGLSTIQKSNKRVITVKDSYLLLTYASFTILAVVALRFSLFTKFFESLFSRALGVIFALVVGISIYLFKSEKRQFAWVCFAVMVIVLSLYNEDNRGPIDSERARIMLEPYYAVPAGYEYVSNSKIPKLGTGYVNSEMLDLLEKEANRLGNSLDVSYMGVQDYGVLYLLNLKGSGTVELHETKGYERAKEARDSALATQSIVINEQNNIEDYYFYKWLLTSGRYEYHEEKDYFLPVVDTKDASALEKNKKYVSEITPDEIYLYSCPEVWGNSINSLEGVFSEQNIEYEDLQDGSSVKLQFSTAMDGNDIDFLYLEIDDSNYRFSEFKTRSEWSWDLGTKAKYFYPQKYNSGINCIISYRDDAGNEHVLSCALANGRLLIPLGLGRGWLLNGHNDITLKISDGETYYVPKLMQIRFLKLREL